MPNDHKPEIGSTIVIQKETFNAILSRLKEKGYETIGPRVKNDTLIYAPIEQMDDLPRGYITEQDAARFHLKQTGHSRYFDAIPGAQSWKQFLFPPRAELFALRKVNNHWEASTPETKTPSYAFIGVHACELAAIQIQDNIFMRSDFNDPIYRAAANASSS